MQRMTRKFLFVGANGSMRPLLISLPMIEPLLDGVRYLRPDDRPEAPGSGFHVGKPSREKLARALRSQNTQRELVMPNPPPRTPRAPSLRSLVKLAVRCESAEELGKKLKRRFDRQKQRRGIEPGRDRAAEAELDHLLGE